MHTPIPTTSPTAARTARIVGAVHYREGDGPRLEIRPGPVEVTATEHDVTIGWADGDTRGSAAMPLSEFRRYLDAQAIVLDTPPP